MNQMTGVASCFSPECKKIMDFLLEFHDDVDEREYRLKMFITPLQVFNVIGFSHGSVRSAMQRLFKGGYTRKNSNYGMYQTDEKLYDKFITDSKAFVRKKPIPITPSNQYMKKKEVKIET